MSDAQTGVQHVDGGVWYSESRSAWFLGVSRNQIRDFIARKLVTAKQSPAGRIKVLLSSLLLLKINRISSAKQADSGEHEV